MEQDIYNQLCYYKAYEKAAAEKFVVKVREEVEAGDENADPAYQAPPLVEPVYKCKKCKNRERFKREDSDIVCLECGLVVSAVVDMGDPYRHFEDKEDRSHFGPANNPLFSSSWNNRTFCVKKTDREATGIAAKIYASDSWGMNTRATYKDADNEAAFAVIRDVVCNLTLHPRIAEVAVLHFAKYRNAREKLQNRQEIIFACVVLALRAQGTAKEFVKKPRLETKTTPTLPVKCWTREMGEAWLRKEVQGSEDWVAAFTAGVLRGHDDDDMGRRLLLGTERSFAKHLPDPAIAKRVYAAVSVVKEADLSQRPYF